MLPEPRVKLEVLLGLFELFERQHHLELGSKTHLNQYLELHAPLNQEDMSSLFLQRNQQH